MDLKLALNVVLGAVAVGLIGWGYLEPARALHHHGRLGLRSLVDSYWRHIRLIPRALAVASGGAVRHPFGWEGPPFGMVLLVVVTFLGAMSGAVVLVVGPERGEALVWAPVCLVVAIGLGMLLVRDTPGVEHLVQDVPLEDLDGTHFKRS